MVSKNQIKLITGLQQKKYRKQHELFIAEGIKVIQELLNSNFELYHIYTVDVQLFNDLPSGKITGITAEELKKISALTTPNECVALFKVARPANIKQQGLIIALDDVRDPGNLGTIIRLCDWFGIKQIVCSLQCADMYNPKVVQATMGSLSRVNVTYTDLGGFLKGTSLPLFGTFMDGENIYSMQLPDEGIIIMGNEANGISSQIEQMVSDRIAIPRFGDIQKTESLNVATATAIILSEFRRNFSGK